MILRQPYIARGAVCGRLAALGGTEGVVGAFRFLLALEADVVGHGM